MLKIYIVRTAHTYINDVFGKGNLLVLGSDVGHNVLIEKFQNKRDAVGEYQVLRHKLELVNVIDFEMFEE